MTLSPTFVPFTPWTTLDGYVELLDAARRRSTSSSTSRRSSSRIRLLVTAGSPLLELPDIRSGVGAFDPASLTWPWRHRDPRVDALQPDVMRLVGGVAGARVAAEVFDAISALARERAGGLPARQRRAGADSSASRYRCAEPEPSRGTADAEPQPRTDGATL